MMVQLSEITFPEAIERFVSATSLNGNMMFRPVDSQATANLGSDELELL